MASAKLKSKGGSKCKQKRGRPRTARGDAYGVRAGHLGAMGRGGSVMIEIEGLTKVYGEKTAVADLTFRIEPGTVTGFLGPNGAGKSTTMRMIAGLDAPTKGTVRVNGQIYRGTTAPMGELGVMLEARAVHTGRSALNHLLALACTNGIGRQRVDEVINMVGLAGASKKRVGSFSLGMGQRLGVASALLGDPRTVMLDEPVNGLDPEGVLWIRELLKALANEGRTVFVSSHLMSEMALTAGHLIVVGRGRLIADTTVEGFVAQASGRVVRVRSPQATRLAEALLGADVSVTRVPDDCLEIEGLTAEQVGTRAWEHHLPVFELTTRQASLEDAFMELTRDAVDYRSSENASALSTTGAPQ
jgi:ABC-2 type transport system ATP-binding protein